MHRTIEDRRAYDALKKRRRRERLRRMGLDERRRPLKRPEIACIHPDGCPCYDCLYGDVTPTKHVFKDPALAWKAGGM